MLGISPFCRLVYIAVHMMQKIYRCLESSGCKKSCFRLSSAPAGLLLYHVGSIQKVLFQVSRLSSQPVCTIGLTIVTVAPSSFIYAVSISFLNIANQL